MQAFPPRPRTRRAQHPTRPGGDHHRELLAALVETSPGVHVLRAASLLGLNWNSCLYHARRLERDGRLVLRKVGGRVCLFDVRRGAAATRLAPLALRETRNQGIAKLVLGQPGIQQNHISQRLDLAGSVVHRRLMRMQELGLVDRLATGRTVTVYATESLRSALAEMDEQLVPEAVPQMPQWGSVDGETDPWLAPEFGAT